MSTKLKLITPEGDYEVLISDLQAGESRNGRHLLKIWVSILGAEKIIYQACSPLIRQMILENKEIWIGKSIPIKISHMTVGQEPDDARVYEDIRVRGPIK